MVCPQHPNGRDVMDKDGLHAVGAIETAVRSVVAKSTNKVDMMAAIKRKCELATELYSDMHGKFIKPNTTLEEVKSRNDVEMQMYN